MKPRCKKKPRPIDFLSIIHPLYLWGKGRGKNRRATSGGRRSRPLVIYFWLNRRTIDCAGMATAGATDGANLVRLSECLYARHEDWDGGETRAKKGRSADGREGVGALELFPISSSSPLALSQSWQYRAMTSAALADRLWCLWVLNQEAKGQARVTEKSVGTIETKIC